MLMEHIHHLAHIWRMPLGERIMEACTALGISQAELARRCDLSPQRLNNYILNKRPPDLRSLVKIADALNVTPDDLLGANAPSDAELTDILGRLLELEGLDPARAHTIAEAVSATHQVLKALPDQAADADARRLAAHAVWLGKQPR